LAGGEQQEREKDEQTHVGWWGRNFCAHRSCPERSKRLRGGEWRAHGGAVNPFAMATSRSHGGFLHDLSGGNRKLIDE
jgi:hypothetical protein